jgi:hypothetical protein
MKPKLYIELVPSTCWFSNIRDHVDKQQWDIIRRATYKKYYHHCAVCDGQGSQWPVECHEVWEYDDIAYVQTLIETIALCPACHLAKHIGYAKASGRYEMARDQLAKVNNWGYVMTDSYIESAMAIWKKRSEHDWKLDLSWLQNNFNICIAEKR